MRNNLDLIEKIDNYLLGKLSQEEKTQFEAQIAKDSELQSAIENQKLVLQAIHRKGIRADIKKASSPGTGLSGWIWAVIIVITVAIIGHLVVWKFDLLTPTTSKDLVEYNFNGLKTLVEPDVQQFSVEVEKGATIEGKNGTVVFIPSDAFVDNHGNLISGKIDFELVEALSLSDMVLYNLTTTADGQTLETGGMIYTNASIEGQKVNINPTRPLYIEIPTVNKKDSMMVFTGETTPEGNLNWKDPKPLKKYLAQIEFENLDFLPRGFEEKVKEEKKDSKYYADSKAKTDSLYYTLNYDRIVRDNDGYVKEYIHEGVYLCGLEPRLINEIQRKEYAKTFIATKEFEQRIYALHKLEYARDYIKLYVENLDQPLWKTDSLVATKLSDNAKLIFENFAALKHTNVKEPHIYQKQLSAFYNKSIILRKKAQKNLEQSLEEMSDSELNEIINSDKDLFNSLPPLTVSIEDKYSFATTQLGWVNIDRYLKSLDALSEIVHFICDENAPNVKMFQWLNSVTTLTSIGVINNRGFAMFPSADKSVAQQMKNTYSIAISNNLNGFQWCHINFNPYQTDSLQMQLTPISLNNLKAELNQLEGDNSILNKRLGQTQEYIDKERLRRKKQLEQEKIHIQKRLEEEKQTRINQDKEYQKQRLLTKGKREFEARVAKIAFPCEFTQLELDSVDVKMINESEYIELQYLTDDVLTEEVMVYEEISIPFSMIEVAPIIAGCDNENSETQRGCFTSEIQKHIQQNIRYPESARKKGIEGRVNVIFNIEKDGSITKVQTRGPNNALELEAKRLIESISIIKPGQHRGNIVRTTYSVPITFKLN